MADLRVRWPKLPYKGLSPYGPTDRPLFAGRELDTGFCSRLLEMRATRMLVLHGPTGSGKTSFLRAGLIPELEASGRGYVWGNWLSSRRLTLIDCDLRLMSSVKEVSDIPTAGKDLIIVAAVDNVLHFRMFDGDGKVVVDTDEKRLTEQARQIEDLRKQLVGLWPPHELTESEKGRVITAVTSIVEHSPSIPELDAIRRGYFIPKGPMGEPPWSLFVRSTSRPLAELARAVFVLAGGGYTFHTDAGEVIIDLTEARLGYDDAIKFQDAAEKTPDMLVKSFVLFSRRLTETLVLIVDQAEEIFTLQPGPNGQRPRDAFFDFIALLGATPVDLKLIISLRTEYYGRFVHQVHRRDLDATSLREYLLLDLDAEGLRRAIVRPTQKEPVERFGAPFDHYQFSIEAELVEDLVRDLQEACAARWRASCHANRLRQTL